ncbi:MAG TPA: hypothetical protein VE153_37535 [Myxococcus sp.]|nr:hypothetical protein [Myxococcus sp.]
MTRLNKTLPSMLFALLLAACGPVPEGEELEPTESMTKRPVGSSPVEDLEPGEVTQLTFAGDLGSRLGSPVATYASTCTASNQWRTSCGSGSSRDIAYVWRVPETGTYTFSTTGSDFDTVLEVRHYNDSASVLGCNDDTSTTLQSRFTNAFIRGTLLLIIIEGFEGDCGAARLNIIKR